jgi:hypothetical protein
MELPFAALHQLSGRMLDRLDQLPARSATLWASHSACAPAARRIVSWSAWLFWACCPT